MNSNTSSKDEAAAHKKAAKKLKWKFRSSSSPTIYTAALLILLLSFCIIAFTYPNAYVVMADGKKIALVKSPEVVESILEEITGELDKGKDFTIETDIKYEKVHVGEGEFTEPEELREVLESYLSILSSAAAITVNGEPKVWVEDREAAEKVLENLKARFSPEGEVKLVSLDFKEEVEIQEGLVNPDKIVNVTEAEQILASGGEKTVTHVIQEGDTLWSIARKNNMTVAEILAANPGLQEDCILQIGDEIKLVEVKPIINVIVEYEKIENKTIPFEVEHVKDSKLPAGTTKVVQQGEEGEKEVTYRVTTLNGVNILAEVVKTEVIKEPKVKIVHQSTKTRDGIAIASRGGGSGRLAWPLKGRITSGYGYRGKEFHGAIDIDGNQGDPIRAAESGKVAFAGWSGGYGNIIVIDHGNGLTTKYAHCSKINVKVGQTVSRGEVIGSVGCTGRATGSHLHFEVLQNGKQKNPLLYLR
ncbi:MAG: peptidoglycan DD-metalloendopeptidase family protein [Clostridia bacterium]|nr:peptidoglycan DD-metalloendopeptidase family protein [Clostridia bacterium]